MGVSIECWRIRIGCWKGHSRFRVGRRKTTQTRHNCNRNVNGEQHHRVHVERVTVTGAVTKTVRVSSSAIVSLGLHVAIVVAALLMIGGVETNPGPLPKMTGISSLASYSSKMATDSDLTTETQMQTKIDAADEHDITHDYSRFVIPDGYVTEAPSGNLSAGYVTEVPAATPDYSRFVIPDGTEAPSEAPDVLAATPGILYEAGESQELNLHLSSESDDSNLDYSRFVIPDGYVTEAPSGNLSAGYVTDVPAATPVLQNVMTEKTCQRKRMKFDTHCQESSTNHFEFVKADGYVTEAPSGRESLSGNLSAGYVTDVPAATPVSNRSHEKRRVTFDIDSSSDSEGEAQESNKRKSRILPIKALLKKERCCKEKCLKSVCPDAATKARKRVKRKTLQEQAEWVLSYFSMHHQVGAIGRFSYQFFIGLTKVCREAFMNVHGITRSRFYELKTAFEGGLENIAPRNLQKKSVTSAETERSMAWLERFAKDFGDKMPDSPKIHLPSSMTRGDVYERMKADLDEIGFKPCSSKTFLKKWRSNYKNISIPKENRFAKCDDCSKFKQALQKESNREKRKAIQKKRDAHIKLQGAERREYYSHIYKAKQHPNKYMSIILDGMDQNTTAIPKPLFNSKYFSSIWKVACHVVGVIVHGRGQHLYVDVGEVPSDSSATCNMLLQTLSKYKTKLPPVLYLQADNCGRENKNKFLFGLCCLLVELNIFKKIKVNFLMVGHTHEDIDQLFSRISVHLSKFHVPTFSKLLSLLQDSCKKVITTAERYCNYFCVREWILPHLNEMQQHSVPHSFKFTKDEDTGKANIQTRKWASIKTEWQGADHDDATYPYLLKSHPHDYPKRLRPDLSGLKLNTVMNDLRRGVRKGFIKGTELEEWSNFIETLENEESNGVEDGSFPLFDITTYMDDNAEGTTNATTEPNSESTTSESDHIALVHLGRKRREVPQMPPKKEKMIAVYCSTNYSLSWPQIGKVVDILPGKILLHWYSGGADQPCFPLYQPNQKKKIPWIEEIIDEDVISGPFDLTKKRLLPKKIDKFLAIKFRDYFE